MSTVNIGMYNTALDCESVYYEHKFENFITLKIRCLGVRIASLCFLYASIYIYICVCARYGLHL